MLFSVEGLQSMASNADDLLWPNLCTDCQPVGGVGQLAPLFLELNWLSVIRAAWGKSRGGSKLLPSILPKGLWPILSLLSSSVGSLLKRDIVRGHKSGQESHKGNLHLV